MDEDVIELDAEDFGETPSQEEAATETPATEEAKPATEVTDEQILKAINARGIKYNGETVTVENLDDFIGTYQKGLNYDKVKAKAETDDEIMNYITEKANSFGITTKEYIQKVKQYEEEQKKASIEEAKRKLIRGGVDEETAQTVAETKAYMEQLKAERAKFEEEKRAAEAEKKKNEEYSEFMRAYPDVKAEDIPKEVFQKAEEVGLKTAYAEYENKLLKEKIKQMEQSSKNASNSLVTATTESGATEQESKDAFLMGFDSVD